MIEIPTVIFLFRKKKSLLKKTCYFLQKKVQYDISRIRTYLYILLITFEELFPSSTF